MGKQGDCLSYPELALALSAPAIDEIETSDTEVIAVLQMYGNFIILSINCHLPFFSRGGLNRNRISRVPFALTQTLLEAGAESIQPQNVPAGL